MGEEPCETFSWNVLLATSDWEEALVCRRCSNKADETVCAVVMFAGRFEECLSYWDFIVTTDALWTSSRGQNQMRVLIYVLENVPLDWRPKCRTW